MKDVAWIAVDWGTSNLRVWGMSRDGQIAAEASSTDGMGKLDRGNFEPALLSLIDQWLPPNERVPVIACGMVGARQGWIEVPYRQVPCRPIAPDGNGHPETRDPRLTVTVLAGLKQIKPAPDVMRGEETQIAGALLEEKDFDGVICLPGTHTKWVRLQAGEIIDFKTFMTGELFGLLGEKSILRHSLGEHGWEASEFTNGVEIALGDPSALAGRLFSIRAETLLSGLGAAAARARLSGLLVGAELAATRTYWAEADVKVIGSTNQCEIYVDALRVVSRTPRIADTAQVTLAGLRLAHDQLTRGPR